MKPRGRCPARAPGSAIASTSPMPTRRSPCRSRRRPAPRRCCSRTATSPRSRRRAGPRELRARPPRACSIASSSRPDAPRRRSRELAPHLRRRAGHRSRCSNAPAGTSRSPITAASRRRRRNRSRSTDDDAAILEWPLGEHVASRSRRGARAWSSPISEQRDLELERRDRRRGRAMTATTAIEALYLARTASGYVVSALGRTASRARSGPSPSGSCIAGVASSRMSSSRPTHTAASSSASLPAPCASSRRSARRRKPGSSPIPARRARSARSSPGQELATRDLRRAASSAELVAPVFDRRGPRWRAAHVTSHRSRSRSKAASSCAASRQASYWLRGPGVDPHGAPRHRRSRRGASSIVGATQSPSYRDGRRSCTRSRRSPRSRSSSPAPVRERAST